MKLHEFASEFRDLISVVALDKHIPESAIERFSEDIDLTFLGMELSDKNCSKTIKKIEQVMIAGAEFEKIEAERSSRSKSMYVWFGDEANRVKLEIGSSIRPDPFDKRTIKTYIQDFLERNDGLEDIEKYELEEVTLNVLRIERTFIDKLMSVKRHAICGTIEGKVRHIYDVTRMFSMEEIQSFLRNEEELKRLVQITKSTDAFYLQKRGVTKEYDPTEPYEFEAWRHYLTSDVCSNYENLHKDLLYTDEKQNFDLAIDTFSKMSSILKRIGE